MAFPVAYDTLISEFLRRVRQRTTAEVSDADGRSALWQVRVRLYNLARGDEPEADSDPDLPADRMGVTIIRSLPGVAEHVAALASAFHGAACLVWLASDYQPPRWRCSLAHSIQDRGRRVAGAR
jgi:hypothetical protein